MHSPVASWSRTDRRFLWMVAGVVTALALGPAILGALHTPAGTEYTGLHVNSPVDYPVYYALIEYAQRGHIVATDLFTTERGASFPNTFWTVFGLLSAPFHLDPRIVFQIARLLVIPLGVLAWGWSLRFWVREPRRWRWALVFLLFAGGLGFWLSLAQDAAGILRNQNIFSMDIWVSEGFNALTVLHSPHMVASSALIFLAMTLLARSLSGGSVRDAAIAGLCASVLGTFHPFHLLTLAAVPLVAWLALLVRERRLRREDVIRLLVYGLVALPGALSYLVPVLRDATTHARYLQNATPTPTLLVTLVSYGLLVPFAIWGAVRRLKGRDRASLVLVVWVVVHALLLYAPVLFQRRLTQGFQFPLTILAFEGLLAFRSLLGRNAVLARFLIGSGSGALTALLLLLGFGLSPLAVYTLEYRLIYHPETFGFGDSVYQPSDTIAAYRTLGRLANANDVSLGLSRTGLFATGFSGVRTYLGHGVETLRFGDKAAEVVKFFQGVEFDRRTFLKDRGITYVIETLVERAEERVPLATESFLTPVFRGPTTTLYQVRP